MFIVGLFLFVGTALAQTKVTGTVLSQEDGEPIIGATVKIVGAGTGAITDYEGNFTVQMPEGKDMIEITYLGCKTEILKAVNGMRVIMKPDTETLEEVVVVAYGTTKKQSITGSVSTVDQKAIEKRIASNVTSALEGAAPGVQVNNTYGEPGAEPKIRIRGIGSLNGSNTPLYVVDGIIYNGNIADLNPDDIKSMSVLKDAASAALYGNRASAGVVIITTKSGISHEGNSSIDLKINQGFYNRGIKEYDRLGVNDYMETSWKAMKNWAMTGSMALSEDEAKAYASAHLATDVMHQNIWDRASDQLFDENGKMVANVLPGYTDLDWEDNIERTGQRQEYILSGNFTNDKTNVYSSLGYLKEKGYIVSSDYERYTARVNSTYTPNKWITVGVNLNGAISKRHFNDNAKGSYYSNPFNTARYMAPIYPIYSHNADGSIATDKYGNYVYDTESDYLDNRNIAYELRTDTDTRKRNVLNGTAYATVNLPYDFSLTIKGNLAHTSSTRQTYNNPEIGDGATSGGRLANYSNEYEDYTMQELLNWAHEFGDHHIDVMVGHENTHYQTENFDGMNTKMVASGIYVLGNFIQNSYLSGYNEEYATESYLARARYNYDQRYFVDASLRRDGSSRFASSNRWGNFFSFGATWNAKKEEFLRDVKWINQLRLRASYGEVGNDAGVGYYGYQALYYIEKNGGEGALMKQSLSAEDIKWETAQTVDVALEGRLFGRMNFSIGYFDKRNKDLLFAVRLPLSAGSFSYNQDYYNMTVNKNIGTIANRGVEISIDGDVLSKKNWLVNLGFDATFIKNKIIKLPNGDNILSGVHNYTEGRSLYDFYTYHFEGVDQMTGRSLYTLDPDMKATAAQMGELVTINGVDYTTNTSYGKRDFHGTAAPTVYGSVHGNVSWKDLTLSLLATYSLGGKTIDYTYQTLMSTHAMSSGSALHKDALKAWNGVPEGMTETSADRIDPNGVPAMDYNLSSYNNATSDRWLTSASYLVMKNISLSYNLPKKWLTAMNAGINGVTLTAGVENLFTLTGRKGMNPQYSFTGTSDDTYVTARVWNFSLNVNF